MRVSASLVLMCSVGCAMGPKYQRPSVGVPAAFKEATPAAYRGMPPETWRPARPQDAVLKGKWWEIFREPELSALEEQLDVDNQTIAQSFETYMAARAQVAEARAGYFPTVTLNPSATHSQTGGGTAAAFAGLPGTTTGTSVGAGTVAGRGGGATNQNLFSIPLEASWAPDLWGRVQSAVRQQRYAAQVSAADLENVRLTEQAALAQLYFQLRGQDALTELYDRTVAADRRSVELNRAAVQVGISSPEVVAQAEVTLANAEAAAVGIAVNRALYEHAIATLIGRAASDFAVPVKALATPLPAIPIGVPSQLLERRPDVAAAERAMAEANALIGVATAAYYPSLTLATNGGVASTALSTLFSVPSLFWSLGASAAQTIFDGGLRRATVAQYEALYRAGAAAYRQVVLTAFQQVEDDVSTLRVLSRQIARQELAVEAARKYLTIAQASYETGISPYLDVITAQNTLLADEQTLVNLRVSEILAAVQLVQALGGGWDVKKLPTPDETTAPEGVRKVAAP